MPFGLGRVLRATAIIAALAAAYTGGVVTGVVGSRAPQPPPAQTEGAIDEAADRIAAGAAHPVDRAALERAAVEGMLAKLGDPWSTYYQPSEFAALSDSLDGRYSGVGLWLRPGGATGIEVGSVAPRSPSASGGVQAGDALVSVDGRVFNDVGTAATALRGDGSARLAPVIAVVRRGGTDHVLHIRRTVFASSEVSARKLAGGVTLIGVGTFSRGVGRALRAVLAKDRKAATHGIILDLRSNPGGLLSEAVEVASTWLDRGAVVSYEQRAGPRQVLDALGKGDVATPLVLLVDGGTASAAEVVAAALQDRGRAVLVGATTYGKGTVQEPTKLSDGSALELTVGHYLTPTGRSIDGVGVQPDVLVPPSAGAAAAEQRALEVLSGLVAALPAQGRG